MTAHQAAPSPARERGFVLVGVVMFVLALTILGLSLFSLSGYEAQFLKRSTDESQAFYEACGGLERAKFALQAGNTLESVKQGLPLEGVTYARARRWPPQGDPSDTTGPVPWSGTVPIDIRVLAERGDAKRMVEIRILPRRTDDLYKRLITSFRGVRIPTVGGAPPTPRIFQTYLTGEVWQNEADQTWMSCPGVHPPHSIGGVPQPDLDGYYASHWAAATEVFESGNTNKYVLDAGLLGARVFRSTATPGAEFSLREQDATPQPEIDVTGTAVWMFDQGVRFDFLTKVVGMTGLDRLILVARPAPQPQDSTNGIWFFGGLESPTVPVILVSDGRVAIEHFNNAPNSSLISYISIFSAGVFLMGPTSPSTMQLIHAPSVAEDLPGGLIDQLYALGLLPNSDVGANANVPVVAGSWREVTESNPN